MQVESERENENESWGYVDCQYHKSDLHMQQTGEKQGKLS